MSLSRWVPYEVLHLYALHLEVPLGSIDPQSTLTL